MIYTNNFFVLRLLKRALSLIWKNESQVQLHPLQYLIFFLNLFAFELGYSYVSLKKLIRIGKEKREKKNSLVYNVICSTKMLYSLSPTPRITKLDRYKPTVTLMVTMRVLHLSSLIFVSWNTSIWINQLDVDPTRKIA